MFIYIYIHLQKKEYNTASAYKPRLCLYLKFIVKSDLEALLNWKKGALRAAVMESNVSISAEVCINSAVEA